MTKITAVTKDWKHIPELFDILVKITIACFCRLAIDTSRENENIAVELIVKGRFPQKFAQELLELPINVKIEKMS